MIRERPTSERLRRRVRVLGLTAVPLFSAAAGAILVMHVKPGQHAGALGLAGAISTGGFALLLVALRLGAPKRRSFLGVLALSAFLGAINAPVAAVLAGSRVMGVDGYAQLLGYALFGAIVVAPLSSALGASFGLAWFATLKRFSQALERPTLTDVPSLTLRLGLGALGLAAISLLGAALESRSLPPMDRGDFAGSTSLAFPFLVAMLLAFLLFGGLALVAHGLWQGRRLKRLVRAVDAGESEDFCLAPSDLTPETAELVALTRDPICTRVVCRQQASDGDGAYRLNRDRFTPWALMP